MTNNIKWLVYVILGIMLLLPLLYFIHISTHVKLVGHITADTQAVPIYAPEAGRIAQIFVTIGEPIDAGAPLLDINTHTDKASIAAAQHDLQNKQEEKKQLQASLEVIQHILATPESIASSSLSHATLPDETFKLLNDLYLANLDLDQAKENRRTRVEQQKRQLLSEITLIQRNIDLLKRNLEISKNEATARQNALEAKRRDFASLLKLAERGLVPTTDVNRERDLLLQNELFVTDNSKQVGLIELDISNRNLHISQLNMEIDNVAEKALNNYNTARLQFDLRVARLSEHQAVLAKRLQALTAHLNANEPTRNIGDPTQAIVSVIATTTGTITRMHMLSPGDNVTAGMHLATISPESNKLLILAKLSVDDAEKVQVGQWAHVHLREHWYTQTAPLKAQIIGIFVEPDDPQYTVRLALNTQTINLNGKNLPLLPGQRVTIAVATKPERLLNLLFF